MRFKAIERGGDIHCVVTCALPFAYDVLRKTTPLHDEYFRKLEAGLHRLCALSPRQETAALRDFDPAYVSMGSN